MSGICPFCGSDSIKDGSVFRTMVKDSVYYEFRRARCLDCNENIIGVSEYRMAGGQDYIRREDLKPMFGITHGKFMGRWA